MNTSTCPRPPHEVDANADAQRYLSGFDSPTAESPEEEMRVLVAVANDGRPHAVCARCFGSQRGPVSVHWLQDLQAAREMLADGSVDVAVLDVRCHGPELIRELETHGLRIPVVLLTDERIHLAESSCTVPARFLLRDELDETTLLRALRELVGTWGEAWVTDQEARARQAPAFGHEPDSRSSWPSAPRFASDPLGSDLLDHVPVIVGRIDAGGAILDIVGAGLTRLGLNRETLLGAAFADAFPKGRHALQQALDGAGAHFEVCVPSETTGVCYVRFDLFPDHGGGGCVGLLGQETPTRAAADDEVVHAIDAERQRIGADLHDEVGQLLTGITCLSKALEDRLRGRDDLAAEDATAIAQTAKEALAQVRSLAHGLAPVQLSRCGLVGALEEFADLIRRMHHVEVRLDLPRTRPELEPETAMHVFRIVQEAVANAVRHGGSSVVDISLRRLAGSYSLSIRDNGCGFEPAAGSERSGSGLRLMEYRAALIGGTLRLESRRHAGTSLELSFTPTTPRTHETAC